MRSDEAMPGSSISGEIWDMKYRFKREDGTAVDGRIEDTWRRVADALAEAEKPKDREAWAKRFYEVLDGYRFLPAGRILAGAGTGRQVTLFNCFVMGTVEDDLAGIFEALKESALTMQQGGGIGCDFSSLRPKGAAVRGVGADASGPLELHGRVGRHVPHHHVGGLQARRHDGDAVVRSSRHRGLHRGQGRPQPPAHVQPLRARVRRLHGGGEKRRRLAPHLRRHPIQDRQGARSLGPDHALDLRLCRARRDLHRPGQRPQQPRLLRDHPGDQPVRRAAPAALWRVPPGLGQSGGPHEEAVRGRRRISMQASSTMWCAPPCA